MAEWVPIAMFVAVFAALLAGYAVAATLAGVALLFAFVGIATGHFAASDLGFLPGRLFGIVTNQTLIAVPLFVLMGWIMGDKILTRDEIKGLMRNLIYVDAPSVGTTKLSDWIRDNADHLGKRYANELKRRTDRTSSYRVNP